MIERPEELGLPRAGVPLLRDLIHEHTGLFYDDERCDALCERLAPIVVDRGFRSFMDLYYLLRYEALDADWARVLDALAVPETYFWREVDQLQAIASAIVPRLAASNGHGPLRIWSAACASGEEPLTLAMLIEEAGWFARAPIEIYATDGSATAVARARAAVYRDRSFRALPPAMFEKYFVKVPGGYQPIASLRARVVSHAIVNLADESATAPYAGSPVVLCRNAFIYFSPASVSRVVNSFASRMPRRGYLCVGASESLLNLTTPFTLEEIDGAFVYVNG